jgi:hypothetical protein
LIFPSNQTKHNGKQQDSGGWSNWSNLDHSSPRQVLNWAIPPLLWFTQPQQDPLLKEGVDSFIQGFWHHNFGSK